MTEIKKDNNPIPVAVALVPVADDSGQIIGYLTVRRGIEPFTGQQALPGGFVDAQESAEMAATRELEEETRLTGDKFAPSNWRVLCTRVTPRNQLLIFLELSHSVTQEELTGFVPTNETQALQVATPDDVLCFPLHQEVLSACFERLSMQEA